MISKELRDRHMRMCQKFMMLRLDSLFSDLPRGEFMPLQTIYAYSLRNPGTKGIYVSELASQLKVSSPAVSRTLRSLETKGYIERSADKNDRRSTLIRLTEKVTPSGNRSSQISATILTESSTGWARLAWNS